MYYKERKYDRISTNNLEIDYSEQIIYLQSFYKNRAF